MPTDYYSDVLEDTERVDYFRTYINEAMKAIHNDSVPVQRFTVQISTTRLGFEGFLGSHSPRNHKVVWEKFSPINPNFRTSVYHYGTFPSDFQWGVFHPQLIKSKVAGMLMAKGQLVSVCGTLLPMCLATSQDGDTGEVACDSYKQDIPQMVVENFSKQEWSLTITTESSMGLLAYNITPMVTLYHWDLPQALQDINGWDNVKFDLTVFNDYCDFCYETFGDRVKFWMTFNEPHIICTGDYPDALEVSWWGNKSEIQGLAESRLPVFYRRGRKPTSRNCRCLLRQCLHTTKMARHVTPQLSPPSYEYDQDIKVENVPDYYDTAIPELKAVAWGLRRLLNWIKEEYGNPEIYITENGVSTDVGITVDDIDRVLFLKTYIAEALKAQNLDGVQLKGYTAWSLLDSFEWLRGYRVGFGLHNVDFRNPSRPRTPKYSAHYYYQVISQNGFPLSEKEAQIYGHFPDGFVWGVASASYQIEGAWRTDGKGLSIWDTFAHTPEKVANYDNGDFACDSYNRISTDVEMLKKLRVTHYRFSLSWSRILPDGTTRKINEAGLNYYQRLVDALLAANIKPQIYTFYHSQCVTVEHHGRVRENMYSNIVSLGSPSSFAEHWRLGECTQSFRGFKGLLLISPLVVWLRTEVKFFGSLSNEPIHCFKTVDKWRYGILPQFHVGWFAHPVFNGDYSDLMKNRIRERSLAAGLPKSRLPEFTPEEITRIKGTHDFFGLNYYTLVLASNINYPEDAQTYDADRGVGTMHDRIWLDSGSDWLKVYPYGFRNILNYIKEEYGNPPIYVTENGISERGDIDLNDEHRIYYYENYINQAMKARLIDKVDLRGYTAWALMDNLEWAMGFSERFGLYYVNRSDPSLPRIPKKSVSYYATLVNCNGFPDPSQGPHECQNLEPEPEGKCHQNIFCLLQNIYYINTKHLFLQELQNLSRSSPTPSPSTLPPPKPVNFLGLEVSPPDAEVGLYVLFSLTIVGVIGAALITYQFIRVKNKSKRPVLEQIGLERKF
ncbi:hypothetical protein NFI96_013469 [Prochilodus magdalenae]|nr:hypothetical protein NFI96_013469 [Prochilodus magdalenae]